MVSYDTEGTGAGTLSAYDTGRGTPRHDAYDTGRRPAAADLYDTGKRTGKDQSYDTGKAPGQEDPYDTKSTYLDAGRNVAGSPAQVPGPIEMVAGRPPGHPFHPAIRRPCRLSAEHP